MPCLLVGLCLISDVLNHLIGICIVVRQSFDSISVLVILLLVGSGNSLVHCLNLSLGSLNTGLIIVTASILTLVGIDFKFLYLCLSLGQRLTSCL